MIGPRSYPVANRQRATIGTPMKTPDPTPQLLVSAYSQGIFPMDIDGQIRWLSPDPRAIIPLRSFHASKTLMQVYRSGRYEIRFDTAFEEVIAACGNRREETWISEAIVKAYSELHTLGLAHSVESWKGEELVGGLYGVSLGGAFFGESMFHRKRDASKVALVALVERLRAGGFSLLDVQFVTPHLKRFGAVEISRRAYKRRLSAALQSNHAWNNTPPGTDDQP